MKTKIKAIMLLAALGGFSLTSAFAAAEPVEATLDLPPAWQKATPQERWGPERVAKIDALRQLTERIYGLELTSTSRVYDLVLRSDEIAGKLNNFIMGVGQKGETKFKEDGTVQVVCEVLLREVLSEITKTVKEIERKGKIISTEAMESVAQKNQDTRIDVMGNGALPNSDGLKKIQAKRAAEMDAYRQLAERLLGVEVTSATKVKDYVLESDEMEARLAQIIKGATPIKIVYYPDLSCAVTLEVKVGEVFEVIKTYAKRKPTESELVEKQTESETHTFTATGKGAPRPEGATSSTVEAPQPKSEKEAVDDTYRETKSIIRKRIGREIGVLN